MNDKDYVWVDGPFHPDMFDGETPVKLKVNIKDTDLRVYRVEVIHFEPEESMHYIVAKDEIEAENEALEKAGYGHPSDFDVAEAEEMNLNEPIRGKSASRNNDGKITLAKHLLIAHLEKHGCSLTQS